MHEYVNPWLDSVNDDQPDTDFTQFDRYYGTYDSCRLPHQVLICRAISAPPYGIETNDANPMTIRLMVTKAALLRLIDLASGFQHKVIHEPPGGQWSSPLELRQVMTSGSGAQSIYLPGRDEPALNLFYIHRYVYEFFTNLVSALDRLALEIDRLYALCNCKHRIGWGYLLGGLSDRRTNWHVLTSRCSDLSDWLTSGDVRETRKSTSYRNRLVHDGIVPLQVGSLPLGVFLPDDPDNPCVFSTNIQSFCPIEFERVIGVIDKSYELILRDYQAKGRLPL